MEYNGTRANNKAYLIAFIRKHTPSKTTRELYPFSKYPIRLSIQGANLRGNNQEYFELLNDWYLKQNHTKVLRYDGTTYDEGSRVNPNYPPDHLARLDSPRDLKRIQPENIYFSFDLYFSNSNAVLDFVTKVHRKFNCVHADITEQSKDKLGNKTFEYSFPLFPENEFHQKALAIEERIRAKKTHL